MLPEWHHVCVCEVSGLVYCVYVYTEARLLA